MKKSEIFREILSVVCDYAERGNDSYREGYRRGMEEAEMRRRHGGY